MVNYTATEQVYKLNRFVLSSLAYGETIPLEKCFAFLIRNSLVYQARVCCDDADRSSLRAVIFPF
jgi:hypothetical protein